MLHQGRSGLYFYSMDKDVSRTSLRFKTSTTFPHEGELFAHKTVLGSFGNIETG